MQDVVNCCLGLDTKLLLMTSSAAKAMIRFVFSFIRPSTDLIVKPNGDGTKSRRGKYSFFVNVFNVLLIQVKIKKFMLKF